MRDVAPRFITKVPEGTPDQGLAIRRLAKLMGKPLMPWQRLVAHGATSLNPDGSYMFHDVLVTTPRQSGKTTLLGPVQVHRIMTIPNISAYFTAQTGKDARERMLDVMKLVMESPIAPLFRPRYAAGSEGLTLGNGSKLRVFAPGPSALHGTTPHLVTLDEIWKHNQARGTELKGAIGPAQATLGNWSQVWMFSTMGTADSGMLNELVERGRAGAPGLFYAEWSMPDRLDPYEPKTWYVFHPALGNTITVEYLKQEAESQPFGEWMRAYMNRLTSSSDPLMDAEEWDALAVEPNEKPRRRDVTITYEVADGGQSATVMATWRDTDGLACGRVLHDAPGTAWLVPFLASIHRVWKPRAMGADDGGHTRRVTDELRRLGVEIQTLGASDFATASMSLLSKAKERQVKHDGSQPLKEAIGHAVLQPMGDSQRFSRRNSPGSVAPLIAWAVGIWLHDHYDPGPGKAITRF